MFAALTVVVGSVPAAAVPADLTSAVVGPPALTASVPEAVTRKQVRQLQRDLKELGLPVGPTDGVFGPRTARGLCAWRELTGRTGQRRAPRRSELWDVAATQRLRVPDSMVTGLNVSRTCQTMTWVTRSGRGREVRAVFPVSTGKATTKTRTGSFRVFRRQDRWATSREFPSARPNMYRPVYFSGGQAFHGMQRDSWVYDWPASHGCVRMVRKDIDRLWEAGATALGTRFRVYGDW
jgi:hypothetical protein